MVEVEEVVLLILLPIEMVLLVDLVVDRGRILVLVEQELLDKDMLGDLLPIMLMLLVAVEQGVLVLIKGRLEFQVVDLVGMEKEQKL